MTKSGWAGLLQECTEVGGPTRHLVWLMAKEIPFLVTPPGCRVCMGVSGKEDTAEYVLQELVDSLQPEKRAWHLNEFWRGCGK